MIAAGSGLIFDTGAGDWSPAGGGNTPAPTPAGGGPVTPAAPAFPFPGGPATLDPGAPTGPTFRFGGAFDPSTLQPVDTTPWQLPGGAIAPPETGYVRPPTTGNNVPGQAPPPPTQPVQAPPFVAAPVPVTTGAAGVQPGDTLAQQLVDLYRNTFGGGVTYSAGGGPVSAVPIGYAPTLDAGAVAAAPAATDWRTLAGRAVLLALLAGAGYLGYRYYRKRKAAT